MDIQNILSIYSSSPQVGALLKAIADKEVRTISLRGLNASATPVMFASAAGHMPSVVLFVLNDAEEAGYFYHDLTQMLGTESVLFFPSAYRRQVKYGQRDAANEILRTEVLSRLSAIKGDGTVTAAANGSGAVSQSGEEVKCSSLYIVPCPEALSELVVSNKHLDDRTISMRVGEEKDIVEIEKTMRSFGFKEVDYVYEPGQFAVRGSILDVYSYSNEYPYRIDLFGDEIDSIRTFEVQSQLSRERVERMTVVPELSGIVSEKVTFLKFLPSDALVVMKDITFVHDVIDNTFKEGFSQQALTEKLEGATEMEQHVIMQQMKAENSLSSGSMFAEDVVRFKRIEFGGSQTGTPQATITFNTSAQPLFHKNFDLLTQTLEDYTLKGYKLYILADSQKQNQRLRDIFDEMALHKKLADGTEIETTPIAFEPVDKTLHGGFADNSMKVCIFTDHQIFDRFHKYNLRSDAARSGKMALTMKELQEMEPGDYIVHVDFGIGKFAGLVRVPVGDSYQEMIRIVYQNNDKVDVSIHSLYKISKYKRKDSETPPRLSTLGTGAWDRLKEKTKKKIKDIARDLIKLYATRRHEKGYQFSADSFMQHELEASFLYEDTPDQLKATNDVKADMESSRPMDRLVCGDVGFGKTEVAIRAAFKAACDSKQVAVMVPTTVLAYQHYQTFQSRLKGMPVRVDYLSRARSAKQTKQVLADLEAGKIDMIIGTHKRI